MTLLTINEELFGVGLHLYASEDIIDFSALGNSGVRPRLGSRGQDAEPEPGTYFLSFPFFPFPDDIWVDATAIEFGLKRFNNGTDGSRSMHLVPPIIIMIIER